MNEQRRIFFAVTLCLTIWSTWNYFMVEPKRGLSAYPDVVAKSAQNPPLEAVAAGEQAAADAAQNPLGHARAAPRAKPAIEVLRSFRSTLFSGSMRNGDGGLMALDLLQFDERSAEQADAGAPKVPVSMVVTSTNNALGMEGSQARIEWQLGDAPPPAMDFVGPDDLVLAGTASNGLQVQLQAVPRSDAYAIDYVLRVTNPTQSAQLVGASVNIALTPAIEESTSLFAPRQDPIHGLCSVSGSLMRRDLKDLAKAPFTSEPNATWAAIDRGYFLLGVVPLDDPGGEVAMQIQSTAGSMLQLQYRFLGTQVMPQEVWERRFSLYAGPKRDIEMAQVSNALRASIDFTLLRVPLDFLGRPMVFALNYFFQATRSWGVSIMLLTLTVKLLLFPVSYKSMMSMRRTAKLAPELQAIKDKYAHDKERQQAETFKLYRDRNINPVAGCLPMLLQMPVWLTLYKTLGSAVDLYQQSFLWLPDLSRPEPYPVLAVVVGAITMLQQRMTPMAADNQQARVMMTVMPIMFTAFMIAVPSGLVLYILTNSILTILQQLAINSRDMASPQKVSGR